ncbi:MAG: hypothetical protein UZ21_OP11001000252 [Microgenomates bacterium OLB22]|nr:MAG: hypothetical protein UZ21_OP11001000252 [Microgenomates bacterium OLB22]
MGTILWGSSWDGVFKYDTVTKKLTLYSYDDLQFPEDDPTWNRGTTCRKAFLYKEKGLIKVLSQCDHTATYNEADDSWTTIHDPNNTLPPKINRTAKDFGLDLPSFSAFSDIRSGRRYLFNEEAVFTLEEDSFPVKVFDLVTKIRGGAPPHIGFVSSDERYALIFSDLVLGPHTDVADYTLGDIASFTLIDLTTGSSTDLIANSGLGPRPAEDYIRFGQYLEDSTFREEGRNISLYNENDRILSVNTLEKKIAFTIPSPTL